ncbi:MAG: Mov34/MPN/PAD-1 family protein [Gemmatimonadota bacterium]
MTQTETTGERIRSVELAETDRARLEAWAEAGYPHEVCGLLIGEARPDGVRVRTVRQAPNLENERAADRYELDPRAFLAADEQARAAGFDIVGFWHSHPDAAAVPSETDRAAAWPGYIYLIVSVQAGSATDLRVWSLTDGVFERGELT